ncbi:MAG: HD-GYP domain-containing protein, partial [Bacillota bacterium]
EQAQQVYDKIKEKCKETKEEEIPISIALGIATKEKTQEGLYQVLKIAEERMYKNKLDESRSTKSHIVKALLKTLGEKSNETEEHAWRMQALAFSMGEKLDLSQDRLDKLSLLATLHDIGKTIVPAEILTKPGKLNDEEWEIIKQHPETGYRIASSTEEFAYVAEEILSHHEKWDGSGYPRGLKGSEIPMLARIITIVDAYDVMTNSRSYKDPMSKEEAIAELKHCSGKQFDPQLVPHFIELVE